MQSSYHDIFMKFKSVQTFRKVLKKSKVEQFQEHRDIYINSEPYPQVFWSILHLAASCMLHIKEKLQKKQNYFESGCS